MKTKPRSRVLGWTTQAVLQLHAEGHGRRLAMILAPLPGELAWLVTAFDSSTDDKTMEAIFENHAHESLPNQRDVMSAIRFAERYAKAWQRNPQTARACACEAISAPRSLRKAG